MLAITGFSSRTPSRFQSTHDLPPGRGSTRKWNGGPAIACSFSAGTSTISGRAGSSNSGCARGPAGKPPRPGDAVERDPLGAVGVQDGGVGEQLLGAIDRALDASHVGGLLDRELQEDVAPCGRCAETVESRPMDAVDLPAVDQPVAI